MTPRKKKRNLQPAEITEPATEQKLDCSDCNSNLQPFPSNMAEPATEKKASSSSSSMTPDWSLLPGELLHVISENLDNCFDFVHARSVCSSWRSTFPFPSCLLRPSYSLPSFGEYPYESDDLCTLEKIPLFLFRVQTPPASPSEYCIGGVGRDESGDHMELSSPIQCSVKVKFPGSVPTVMNIHDNQILPLGHHYGMIGWVPESWTTDYRGVAVSLNKEGRGGREEFILLLNYTRVLLMLRSDERKWVQLKKISDASCFHLVAFRGRFYMAFLNGDVFFFDPYALEVNRLMPSPPLRSINYLVPSGDDELFLVERFYPFPDSDVIDFNRFTCRVCRLDEEAGKWVVVTELGDRVLFIGHFGNVCCSAKELPDGCGVSGNSIVFTNEPGNVTYAFKYGVHTGREEDDLNIWRYSKENRVNILSTSPVVSLRVQRQAI